MTAEIRVPVELRLELGDALAPSGSADAVLGPVRAVAEDLLADLGLPVAVSVRAARAEGAAPNAFRVWIGNQACRLAQPATLEPAGSDALAARVADGVFHNRELWLTGAVADRLWGSWTGGEGTCPEPTRAAMRELVAHGVLVERLRDAVTPEAEPSSVVPAVEDALARAGGAFRLIVSPSLRAGLRRRADQAAVDDSEDTLDHQLRLLNDGLFYELGLVFPLGELEEDPRLGEGEFRLRLNDVRTPPQAGLAADEFLVNDTPDRLELLAVSARDAVNPVSGAAFAIVRGANAAARCRAAAGLTTWDRQEYLILSASAVIRRFAGALLNTDVVDFAAAQLGRAFPALVTHAQQAFDRVLLTQILRRLLHEGIGIRDLRSILESLLALQRRSRVDLTRYITFFTGTDAACPSVVGSATGPGGKLDSLTYAEGLRIGLKQPISHKYTGGGNALAVYLVDPGIEQRLTDPTPLTGEEHAGLIQAVADEVGSLPAGALDPVVLTSAPIRARLRREIEKEFPRLAVVSYQELAPDLSIQPIARISATPGPPPPVSPPETAVLRE